MQYLIINTILFWVVANRIEKNLTLITTERINIFINWANNTQYLFVFYIHKNDGYMENCIIQLK